MTPHDQQLDQVLDKLIRDVETAVHSLYRGQVRQQTVKAKTDSHRKMAREALGALLRGAPAASAAVTTGQHSANGAMMAPDEVAAITRCIMAWLPMGAPTAAPESRCVPAGRELLPSWGEREKARNAVRRASGT
jgi:hypothetical protein